MFMDTDVEASEDGMLSCRVFTKLSAKRGLAIAYHPSVCLSVCL